MKLSCAVASALALLPAASLAFAPASLRTPPVVSRTDTSLDGWVRDVFDKRSTDREDQKKAIVNRLKTDIKTGLSTTFKDAEDDDVDEFDAVLAKNTAEGNFKYIPSKEVTGLETHIYRLCATMAQQCYDLDKKGIEEFQLSTEEHETETLICDMQGTFAATNPNFGAAVCGDTMMLAWRGTNPGQHPVDLINDAAMSPTANMAWRDHSKTLRCQGAMLSLAMNDLTKYEESLIAECKKRGIKEIVTTGHSLGGGIGQCAHTIIRAQMEIEGSPWAELKGDVNIRSCVFSAPMTTVLIDDFNDATENFIEELNANSCNSIYYNDPIPRGYGYLSFIEDFVEACVPYLTDPLPGIFFKRRLRVLAENLVDKVIDSEQIESIVDAICEYIHPGKIIFYETPDSEPRVLEDMGFAYDGDKKDTLRSVKYVKKKNENPLELGFAEWHMSIVQPGVGYASEFLH